MAPAVYPGKAGQTYQAAGGKAERAVKKAGKGKHGSEGNQKAEKTPDAGNRGKRSGGFRGK